MGICGPAAPNCTLYNLGEDPWVFEPDPDIAGIGVRLLKSIDYSNDLRITTEHW